jgi:hypothetical protein
MPPKRKAQVSAVELQQEHSQDQESTNKRANSAKGKKQQQQDPEGDDAIITQFKPVIGQWGLNDSNIKRIGCRGETILHNYCKYINTTPIEVYKFLIDTKGCDVNAQNKDKNTPLRDAIYCLDQDYDDDITALAYLINQTNIGVNTKYTDDFTLFHSACTINLSNTRYSAKQNAECDATLCQVVELIAERCVQEVFDEETPLEATATM